MATVKISNGIVDLLDEAVVEIARLDSPTNLVCGRLRTLQQHLKPLSTTVGEIAKRIDVSPRDVLDAAQAIGVDVFWHDGQRFDTVADLRSYLSSAAHINLVPELEFDLIANQQERLATQLSVEVDQLRTGTNDAADKPTSNDPIWGKSARKFVGSEQIPPNAVADKGQPQTSYLEKALGMSSQNQSSNIQQLLIDAAAEIAALDGTDNNIFRRLMAELQNQSRPQMADGPDSLPPADPVAKPPRKFAPSDSAAPTKTASDKKHTG